MNPQIWSVKVSAASNALIVRAWRWHRSSSHSFAWRRISLGSFSDQASRPWLGLINSFDFLVHSHLLIIHISDQSSSFQLSVDPEPGRDPGPKRQRQRQCCYTIQILWFHISCQALLGSLRAVNTWQYSSECKRLWFQSCSCGRHHVDLVHIGGMANMNRHLLDRNSLVASHTHS